MSSVDIVNFRTWLKDPVTEALFKSLRHIREEVEGGMVNASNIEAKDCHLRMTKLLGIREGIDLVLEVTCEELDDGEDVNEESNQASGAPSASEAEED